MSAYRKMLENAVDVLLDEHDRINTKGILDAMFVEPDYPKNLLNVNKDRLFADVVAYYEIRHEAKYAVAVSRLDGSDLRLFFSSDIEDLEMTLELMGIVVIQHAFLFNEKLGKYEEAPFRLEGSPEKPLRFSLIIGKEAA